MNANEIKSFEDLWTALWNIIYKIIAFFKGADDNDQVTIGGAHLEDITNVYPEK